MDPLAHLGQGGSGEGTRTRCIAALRWNLCPVPANLVCGRMAEPTRGFRLLRELPCVRVHSSRCGHFCTGLARRELGHPPRVWTPGMGHGACQESGQMILLRLSS